MKRRFFMWMTIACILVVGVSVTRMTRDFVASQGVETADIMNVMDTGSTPVAAAAGAVGETAEEEGTVEETVEETEEETVEETTFAVPDEDRADTSLETTPVKSPGETIQESPKVSLNTAQMENIQETVKSPLDPVIYEQTAEAEEETIVYNAEMLFERFSQVEKNVLEIWGNIAPDNRTANLAAAEQERVLWEYERNQVYNLICSRMTPEEAEALKVLELEWAKERDIYAERASEKSSMKNAYNQNPEYTKALAEKTKERCYWLVSKYEDILNQETAQRE